MAPYLGAGEVGERGEVARVDSGAPGGHHWRKQGGMVESNAIGDEVGREDGVEVGNDRREVGVGVGTLVGRIVGNLVGLDAGTMVGRRSGARLGTRDGRRGWCVVWCIGRSGVHGRNMVGHPCGLWTGNMGGRTVGPEARRGERWSEDRGRRWSGDDVDGVWGGVWSGAGVGNMVGREGGRVVGTGDGHGVGGWYVAHPVAEGSLPDAVQEEVAVVVDV